MGNGFLIWLGKVHACVRRRAHRFKTAPNARLLRSILGLCSSHFAAAEAALTVGSELAEVHQLFMSY